MVWGIMSVKVLSGVLWLVVSYCECFYEKR